MGPANLFDSDPVVWLFTGDSVTQGAVHTFGWRDYSQLFAERVRYEMRRTRDAVINTAISGRRITDLAADLDWSVLRHRPDVISLMFGLNDCPKGEAGLDEFQRTYRQVLDQLSGTPLLIHTPNRVLATDSSRRENLPAYVDTVRTLAKEFDAILVDHHADWAQIEADNNLDHWIGHGCHPNEYGHRAMARTLFRELGIWDANSHTGRLLIP